MDGGLDCWVSAVGSWLAEEDGMRTLAHLDRSDQPWLNLQRSDAACPVRWMLNDVGGRRFLDAYCRQQLMTNGAGGCSLVWIGEEGAAG
ncbi:hypothetical protein ACLOJK_024128 [Asimina triloba]